MTWHGVTLRDGITQAIQGLVQSVDLLTDAMERTWEVGRLRLLVSDELRERFARQWRKWQTADGAPGLEEVRKHSEAMRRAWAALDTAATEAGHHPMKPEVRETRNADGKILALVRTFAEARALANEEDPREREIWTLAACRNWGRGAHMMPNNTVWCSTKFHDAVATNTTSLIVT
jgi:hypothetical protein